MQELDMLLDSRRSEVTKKQYTCCDYCAEIQSCL